MDDTLLPKSSIVIRYRYSINPVSKVKIKVSVPTLVKHFVGTLLHGNDFSNQICFENPVHILEKSTVVVLKISGLFFFPLNTRVKCKLRLLGVRLIFIPCDIKMRYIRKIKTSDPTVNMCRLISLWVWSQNFKKSEMVD